MHISVNVILNIYINSCIINVIYECEITFTCLQFQTFTDSVSCIEMLITLAVYKHDFPLLVCSSAYTVYLS